MVDVEGRDCASCGQRLAADAAYCSSCGTRQDRPCASCGAALEPGSRFCLRCGAPTEVDRSAAAPTSPPVAERRWASVLFADLVGFTTLSESRDPEQVRELLSVYFARCRRIVAAYDGVVEKFIGDAVMAVWGVPTAHEDDAERAVRVGVELAAMVTAFGEELDTELALRVGVVTGEVAATIGATSEGMVAGDPVNTAARVQTAAAPGRVYVDPTTRSLTSGVVEFDDTGEHTLKGKSGTTRLFAVRTVHAERPRRDSIRATLVGRHDELDQLSAAFTDVSSAGRPRLVVVEGEPGMGKSRLVEEFQTLLDEAGVVALWHRGRSLSYGDGIAFRALADAVRTRLGIVEGDPADLVRLRIIAWADDAPADERRQLVDGLLVLLGLPDGPSGMTSGDLFTAWTLFFERVGSGAPVVLVLEDAHNADDGLLDFVEHALATTRSPFLVIALARPSLLARRPDWGGRRAEVVPLRPLDPESMAALVSELVEGLSDDDSARLAGRAGGVPLFAVETVRMLADGRGGELQDGRVRLTDRQQSVLNDDDAPQSLRSLVQSRIDGLADDERRIVADASVLGLTFTLDGLAALASDRDGLEPHVSSLLGREILTIDDDSFSADRGQLRFVHAVVRQVAYSTLSRRDRKARHLAAVDYLGTQQNDGDELDSLIAQHLLDALDACFDDDPDRSLIGGRAAERLTSAGERARRLGSPAAGLRLLTRAIELYDDPHGRALSQVSASLCAGMTGDVAEAVGLADVALVELEREGTTEEWARCVAACVHAEAGAQHPRRVIEIAVPRLDRLRSEPAVRDSLLTVLEALVLATKNLDDTPWDSAELAPLLHELISLSDASGEPAHLFRIHRFRAILAQGDGDEPAAAEHLRRAIAIAPDYGVQSVSSAYSYLSGMVGGDDLLSAVDIARQGVEDARRRGSVPGMHMCTWMVLDGLFVMGRLDEMAATLDDLDPADVQGYSRSGLADLANVLGWATGRARPRWHLDEEVEGYTAEVMLNAEAASRALAVGRPWEGVRHVARLVELTVGEEGGGLIASAAPVWSSVAVATDDQDLARRVRTALERVDVDGGSQMERGLGGFARGRLARLTGEADGVEQLRNAIRVLDEYGAHGYAALARLDLAHLLGARHPESRHLRAQGTASLERIGAAGWLRPSTHPHRTGG